MGSFVEGACAGKKEVIYKGGLRILRDSGRSAGVTFAKTKPQNNPTRDRQHPTVIATDIIHPS